ncbi:Zn(2)-C6 fungal-type domain-containing protein [Fusarium falciforme]|uniref:Zn(2)-C6 fungal-type domain-containing protein n=1 Tax=Fusarium falciforme TaxID=195108 RepID=UPI0023015613|nr:Zn(2)-C6 fungal-type domain-containing protein [Fusarium falciforme]WAO85916.1 Zn(2)-C6 fungal-type domain-containing protein [Fusarium falciforme]
METHDTRPTNAGVIKRIRQACANCRRRKVKCSGERPVCTHCRQSRRSCVYEPYSVTAGETGHTVPRVSNATISSQLLERISSLESALSRLSQGNFDAHVQTSPSSAFSSTPRRMPSLHHNQDQPDLNLDSIVQNSVLDSFSFDGLPPPEVVQSLVDTYFARVHNQPYSFFHRTSFYASLSTMSIPRCLLFAVLAYAVRFSDQPYFVGKVQQASDAYSRQSWLCVIEDHLSVDNNLDLSVIQTVTLLAIVDYTAARISSGWLRLGLAIRLSQDVDLMSEPSFFLPPTEREERRRTFWSIYLVDKLISCARSRPAAVADDDCTLHLPCNEDVFQDRGEDGENVPTLRQVLSWDVPLANPPSPFGLAVVATSIFGRCTKYAHGRSAGEMLTPLDPQSDFALTNASLLLLESYLKNHDQPILDLVQNGPQADTNIDEKQVGHLVFSHALFHLCYCLLNHPFLIRLRLRPIAARVPKSFTSNAFHAAQENARKLTDLLLAGTTGVVPMESSFYTYCASIAAGIHSLAFGAQHQGVDVDQYDSQRYYQRCIEVLERLGVLWPMVPNMLTKLREFDAHSESYAHLFNAACLADELDGIAENTLWSLVDYGMLAREVPGNSPGNVSFLSNLPSPSKWIPGGDYMAASPTSEARNQLLFVGTQEPLTRL